MFTGLVESLGRVVAVTDGNGGRRIRIADPIFCEAAVGDSIAVNGACLTVVTLAVDQADFQIGPETLLKTNLGRLAVGHRVNLERSLRVGDRLGGHFVQGHVDTIARIASRSRNGEWVDLRFRCDAEWSKLMVPKGSIAVDGISLTLVDVADGEFSVMLIPHTLAVTTLGFKEIGDDVNLETDMLAKHVAKLVSALR